MDKFTEGADDQITKNAKRMQSAVLRFFYLKGAAYAPYVMDLPANTSDEEEMKDAGSSLYMLQDDPSDKAEMGNLRLKPPSSNQRWNRSPTTASLTTGVGRALVM